MEGDAGEMPVEKPLSLYQSFPDFDETTLQCLTTWPQLAEQAGTFYIDLLAPASKDPCVPSPLNPDPALKLASELRSLLAHIIIMKSSGSLEASGYENQIIFRLIYKYEALNRNFAAYMIQRCFRAKFAKGADKKAAKLAFSKLLIASPANASTVEEREIRRSMIQSIMETASQ
ncbi:hypothetical protein TVAG_390450 [Trichomonas vaginalis G3]|uniref:Uncharacterized protein n=1 Tax=Trichomonas vaginalis (strain ATCC PRA-98 / G3) TaxID=412133 RepID=A2ESU9_TRIV3|nr:hypothetical protein TVAGG3_0182070 [Trichomonas vaginalis G3]EAY04275.1 hypothetical protein TVAG_390450 [Trichomonas vaginalis G3]KAI5549368.1 hypothetical protein TVAGG3_0182070 [Trichomonas vaginalis G3]|eukprot:XP_001316498.1 hypothetical protein [Trichomonas vaginalis G3]